MKKLLCILLCLTMIVPAAVSLAEYEYITDVAINLTIPEAGTMVIDSHPPTISLSSGFCSIHEAFWAYIDQNVPEGQLKYKPYDSQHVFTAGEEMLVYIAIDAITNYRFTDSTKFTANSNVTIYDHFLNSRANNAFVILKIRIPGGDPDPQPSQPTESTEKVTLKKLKSVKLKALSAKKLEVKWKKLSKKEQSKIQKFEIQYSTDKTFKTGVKKKWAKKTKNSYTIKGLKKNTKYYVRIRAYKKDGNIIYVSKWVTKNKKTKKK